MQNTKLLSIAENSKHLRDIITAEIENDGEALEFLEAIGNDVTDMYDELKREITQKQEEVCMLENEVEDTPDFEKIETGLGNIYFQCDCLRHQMQIENFINNNLL